MELNEIVDIYLQTYIYKMSVLKLLYVSGAPVPRGQHRKPQK